MSHRQPVTGLSCPHCQINFTDTEFAGACSCCEHPPGGAVRAGAGVLCWHCNKPSMLVDGPLGLYLRGWADEAERQEWMADPGLIRVLAARQLAGQVEPPEVARMAREARP